MRQPILEKQTNSSRPATFIGLLVVVALLISTFILAYLRQDDIKQREVLENQLLETKKSLERIQLAMARGDMKGAFTELAQARKNVSGDMTPRLAAAPAKTPPPLKQENPATAADETAGARSPAVVATAATPPVAATAQQSPAVVPSAVLRMAPDEDPRPFILAGTGEQLLVVEKDLKRLHLFHYGNSGFNLVKSYPCIVGANDHDKRREGDHATPVGVYFTLRYISAKSLPGKYGYGAFVINYPNFLDRRASKNGTGIWLHGHDPSRSLGEEELQNTQGCIVVDNDVLRELAERLQAGGTPIVIVKRLETAKKLHQRQMAEGLTTFMKSWAKGWESGSVDRFMSHYASEFINSDGMNYQSFKRQKEKVNRGKKFIRVTIENQAILISGEANEETAVVRFNQRYRSSNYASDSRKIFYLKKRGPEWRIVGESLL